MNAAVVAVTGTLKHSILRRAAMEARNGRLRRETPVLLRRADDTLVERVVDLAFRETTPEFDGWTIVDFKTDREFEPHQPAYATQFGLYVEAVRKATNLPTRGILLIV